jgi:hypothetical protein
MAALMVADVVFDKLGNGAVKVDALTAALQDYASTGKMTQGLTDVFGQDLEYLGKNAMYASDATHGFTGALADLSSYIPGLDTLSEWTFGTSFSDSTERMQALDESLTAFIGTQKDAKKAGEIWNEILKKSGLDTGQLIELLPNASSALRELQKTAHSGAGAQGELAGQTAKSTEELEKQKEAAEAAEKAFDDLFDRYMSADKAAIEYEKTLASTNKELKEGKKALDSSSEAGQKNRTATLALIEAVKDQREANIRNGMSVDKADGLYRKQIETLGRTMEKLGFTRKEVEKLIGKYRDVPGKVGTSIETPDLPKASSGIKGYKKQLDNLTRKIKTHVSVEGDKAAYAKLTRLLVAQQAAKKGISVSAAQSAFNKNAYAEGGWTGPGSKYQPAGIVHADEFVVKADSRRRIERQAPGLLAEMNATGQLPGHAAGGVVMPFPVNARYTQIMSMADALSKVAPAFGNWPSSPSAQRGDSGVWRKVLQLIRSGPDSGSFGNAYRPGDPKWHGSGRAVDWMGFNQDALASYLASKRPLELIHRTNNRDYAYTRGVNKGSFNSSLMQAHRNHIHIAMAGGGTIMEPVFGVGQSGATYSFGEGGRPETVTPGISSGASTTVNINVYVPPTVNKAEVGREVAGVLESYLDRGGSVRVKGVKLL